jgi:hypothetical protein
MSAKQPSKPPSDERCEPRLQIVRADEKMRRQSQRRPSQDQGIRKDQRGQEQPADKERAQKNR